MALSKRLRRSEVIGRLAVPRAWLNLIEPLMFGSREFDLPVVDGSTGMFWEFRCTVRLGRYKKPVLQTQGWLKFVNHKGLRAGDSVELKAAEHEFRGTRFVLKARRLAPDGQHWLDV